MAGRSGVGQLASPISQMLPARFAAEARDFTGDIENFGLLDKDQKKAIRKGLKLMCRESQMGVAAAQMALADAKLAAGTVDPDRIGCVFGTDYMLTLPEDFSAAINRCRTEDGKFDYARWGTDGMAEVTPLWLLKYLPNMPASHVAIYNDLRGPNNSITHREAAANLAVAEAFRTITRGSADIMAAGATGTRVHPMKAVHAAQTEELATNGVEPEKASRPFDRNRTGMVLGEGAGLVVLEELESAQRRGRGFMRKSSAAARRRRPTRTSSPGAMWRLRTSSAAAWRKASCLLPSWATLTPTAFPRTRATRMKHEQFTIRLALGPIRFPSRRRKASLEILAPAAESWS